MTNNRQTQEQHKSCYYSKQEKQRALNETQNTKRRLKNMKEILLDAKEENYGQNQLILELIEQYNDMDRKYQENLQIQDSLNEQLYQEKRNNNDLQIVNDKQKSDFSLFEQKFIQENQQQQKKIINLEQIIEELQQQYKNSQQKNQSLLFNQKNEELQNKQNQEFQVQKMNNMNIKLNNDNQLLLQQIKEQEKLINEQANKIKDLLNVKELKEQNSSEIRQIRDLKSSIIDMEREKQSKEIEYFENIKLLNEKLQYLEDKYHTQLIEKDQKLNQLNEKVINDNFQFEMLLEKIQGLEQLLLQSKIKKQNMKNKFKQMYDDLLEEIQILKNKVEH